MERECGSRVQGRSVLFRFSRANCNIVPYKFLPIPTLYFPQRPQPPSRATAVLVFLHQYHFIHCQCPLKHLPSLPYSVARVVFSVSVPYLLVLLFYFIPSGTTLSPSPPSASKLTTVQYSTVQPMPSPWRC